MKQSPEKSLAEQKPRETSVSKFKMHVFIVDDKLSNQPLYHSEVREVVVPANTNEIRSRESESIKKLKDGD